MDTRPHTHEVRMCSDFAPFNHRPESESDVYHFNGNIAIMFGTCFFSLIPYKEKWQRHDDESPRWTSVNALTCQTHDTDLLPLLVTPLGWEQHKEWDRNYSTAYWDVSVYPNMLAWDSIQQHVQYHCPPANQLVSAIRTMWALGTYGDSNPWYYLSQQQRMNPASARWCATRAREPMMRVVHTDGDPTIVLDVQPGHITA